MGDSPSRPGPAGLRRPAPRQRDDVVGALTRRLQLTTEGRGGSLFLVGGAGAGKSRLVDRTGALAGDAFAVAQARGHPLEAAVPFALLASACQSPAPGDGPVPSAILAGGLTQAAAALLGWVDGLSKPRPLLIALDDLHWADSGSLQALSFLARRLARRRVALIAALRPWPPAALDLAEALTAEGLASTVQLRALDRPESATLLAEAAGAPLPPGTAEQAWRLTAGNPGLLMAAAAVLAETGALPAPDGNELGAYGRALVRAKLAGLPAPARACARALAVLGEEARESLVGAVAGVEGDDGVAGLSVLYATGLVVERRPGWVTFPDPLLRRAVYQSLDPPARSRLHARAFDRLADSADTAGAARHAIAADAVGNPRAVNVLWALGGADLSTGAVEGAVAHLAAAVDLAGGACPPALLSALADAFMVAGRPAEAVPAYRRLLALGEAGSPVVDRAGRMLTQALVHAGRLEDAATGARPGRGLPPALEIYAAQRAHGPVTALTTPEQTTEQPAGTAEELEAFRCFLAFMTGDGEALTRLESLARAAALGPVTGVEAALHRTWDPLFFFAFGAVYSERFADAAWAYEVAVARARAGGALRDLGALALVQAVLLARQGDPRGALAVLDAVEAEVGIEPMRQPYAAMARATALLTIGRTTEALSFIGQALGPPDGRPNPLLALAGGDLRARCALDEGRAGDAAAAYLEVEAIAHRSGHGEPCIVPWASGAIDAFLATGQLADAERVAGWLEERAGNLACRWPAFVAGAARAALAAAAGMGEEADALYREALAMDVPLPLERAQVLVRYGSWARRVNQPSRARAALAEALALAEQAGAAPLAARAASELAVAGGRRRRRRGAATELTAGELRVAALAATGATNAEIGRELHITVKTVETHLGRVYKKLGVSSRRELRGQTFAPPGPGSDR